MTFKNIFYGLWFITDSGLTIQLEDFFKSLLITTKGKHKSL